MRDTVRVRVRVGAREGSERDLVAREGGGLLDRALSRLDGVPVVTRVGGVVNVQRHGHLVPSLGAGGRTRVVLERVGCGLTLLVREPRAAWLGVRVGVWVGRGEGVREGVRVGVRVGVGAGEGWEKS